MHRIATLSLLLLSCTLPGALAQGALAGQTNVFTIVVAVGICVFFLALIGLLLFLLWRNRHPAPPPKEGPKRHIAIRILIFFIEDLLFEIIGLIFFIYEVLNLNLPASVWVTSNGLLLQMGQISIAFYVFSTLKYALIIFEIVVGHFFPELEEHITMKAYKLGVRSDWNSVLQAIIFIPSIIIDGLLLNAETVTPVGSSNWFPGDQVALIVVDTFLWLKLTGRLQLNLYSSKGRPPYDVKGFAYAIVNLLYTLFLILLLILVHLDTIESTGMTMTRNMLIVLINVLTHHYVCAYASMMAQGIPALDKALKGSKARIKQLKLFIRYLRHSPIPIIFTLGFFAYSAWVYVSLWYITFSVALNVNNPGALQGAIYVVVILLDIWNAFYCWNWLYAFLKRLGGYLRWRKPLPDCESYAKEINGILGQCSASFRMNNAGEVQ